ncbi:cAMP response element binding (CREB) protein [Macrophomina phaseolina MS6]|uniref:cAMP response element binding (CREB) protein n=1 Tax=Macrophomina phaseolina (strain MS6) TaxID=1126212 RepID=K2RYF5_MACPH|nr:cAMP response element binding (CREB) protein [Macrophomina phaseolina MS6]
MASTIESPFFFEPWPSSGVNMPDYADPMVMSNSFGSFFDDALLAKVSSSRAPPRLNDFSFDPDKHDRHDVVHSQTHLDQNSQTIARNDVLSDAPSWDINEPDAEHTEIVTYESKPQEQATATIRSGPEGGSKRGNSNKSRNQFSSARGHPKKTTGAEDARKKREQNLEKNRIAANKCRQRKKDWVAKIDNRHRDLAAHNKFLMAEVDSLSSAVFELKVLAFQHVECGYAPIHEYIKREAERVPVRAVAGQYMAFDERLSSAEPASSWCLAYI